MRDVLAMPTSDGSPGIFMKFTSEGQEKMAKATAGAVGRRIALVIDGFVVRVLSLDTPLKENVVIVVFDKLEALDLADRINKYRLAQ